MKSLIILSLVLSTASCAGVTKFFGGRPNPTAQHSEKSQRFAAASPTTKSGALSMSQEDEALYKEMEDWTQTLKRNGHGHQDSKVQEVLRSRESFIVKVGDRLGDKEEAVRYAKYLMRNSEVVTDAVRRYSQDIVAARQVALKESHSYRKSTRKRHGNCVLAAKSFGNEGTENSGLLFRVGDEQVLYARCYLVVPPKHFGKNLRLSMWAGTALVGEQQKTPSKDFVDFTLQFAGSSLYRTNGKKRRCPVAC